MRHILSLLTVFSCLTYFAQAQGDWRTYTKSTDSADNTMKSPGSGIVVHQSPEIQMLSSRFKLEHSGKSNLKGYRVQVFVGERNRANEIKGRVAEFYPEVPAEINYLAPNFRVRVGNFRSNLDADRFLRQIKSDFPNAYIVPDEIGLPSLY